jgi:hypothetical protein
MGMDRAVKVKLWRKRGEMRFYSVCVVKVVEVF